MRLLPTILAASCCYNTIAQLTGDPPPSLAFKVTSGENDNYFLRDNLTSAQLLVTTSNSTASSRRLVIALPAGNSGVLAYFHPSESNNNSVFGVGVAEGSFQSVMADFSNVGVRVDLNFSGNATLGTTIIGAVRAMRGELRSDQYTYLITLNILRCRLHGWRGGHQQHLQLHARRIQ